MLAVLRSLVTRLDGARHHRLLERATLLYAALPFLVFTLGWLRPAVGLPVAAITLAGLYRAQRPVVSRPALAPIDARAAATLAFAVVAVIVVMIYSGTGGYAVQVGGHYRNNSFILDLMRYPWPLGFEDVGSRREPGVLAFYLGNAISPALVGKLLGWRAAFQFQFLWSCLALFLAVCWFLRLVGRFSPRYVLVFLLFGGLDVVGWWLLFGEMPAPIQGPDLWVRVYAREAQEMGGVFWIFPATLTLLFNSPHHVLCAWPVLMMSLDDLANAESARRVGLLVAFALFWSAFSFVGMAPFVLLGLWVARGREMWSFENLGAGVVVLGTTLLYIGSNNGDYLQGWLWQFQDLRQTGWLLLLFYVLEFGVYVALLQLIAPRGEGLLHPRWRWVAVASLLAAPLYRMGDYSDFTTKASVPALLVLQICIARGLALAPRERRVARGFMVMALCVGAFSGLSHIAAAQLFGLRRGPPSINAVRPTNELERAARGGQLFSDGQGFFWSLVGAPVVYQTTGLEPPRNPSPPSRRDR